MVLNGAVVVEIGDEPIAASASTNGLALLAEVDVLGEVLRRDGPNLEVHHCVVGTAHFRAAADERPFLLDLVDLEDLVGLVLVRLTGEHRA